jgi:hypothetical protein
MASAPPKIIIVQGVANTGKSTAIKQAMNHFGLFVGSSAGDVLVCANLYINGAGYNIGFASGGDSGLVVRANIKFLRSHKLTHMVVACRSSGATIAELIKYAQSLGVSPIFIRASYPPNPGLAAMIVGHIP